MSTDLVLELESKPAVRVYKKEMEDCFDQAEDVLHIENKVSDRRRRLKKVLWKILNNINNEDRAVIERNYTIRDGGVYRYNSKYSIHNPSLLIENHLEKIVNIADSRYQEKIKRVLNEIKQKEVFSNGNRNDFKLKIDNSNIPRKYTFPYEAKYIKARPVGYTHTTVDINISIFDSNEDKKDELKIYRDGGSSTKETLEKVVIKREDIEECLLNEKEIRKDTLQNIESTMRMMEEEFRDLIVVSTI